MAKVFLNSSMRPALISKPCIASSSKYFEHPGFSINNERAVGWSPH
jgi:hypothetical protein